NNGFATRSRRANSSAGAAEFRRFPAPDLADDELQTPLERALRSLLLPRARPNQETRRTQGQIPSPKQRDSAVPASSRHARVVHFQIYVDRPRGTRKIDENVHLRPGSDRRGAGGRRFRRPDDEIEELLPEDGGFWIFVTSRKKEIESFGSELPRALADCVDPPRFVMEAISEVFPVAASNNSYDLGWACVLLLESLIQVMVDPVLGKERMLVTPSMKGKAEEIAETWKRSLEERGGIENVKTPDVHTFLQHLVTFGIVKKEDGDLYRKLVVALAWRKQMPKLAVSLGLGDKMPDMIEELIGKGQQVDAVHFTYEVGLANKYPPVPLLRAFLKDAKKAATSILEDHNNSGRAALMAAKKEQSAIRAVLRCIEEYKLEAEFPPESLKKRLEQLEKAKIEKKKPASPAAKRTRASNGGPMPPAKAGRSTNAYVSSFPYRPTYIRSPSHSQYPSPVPAYPAVPAVYNRSPTGTRWIVPRLSGQLSGIRDGTCLPASLLLINK
ncbi:frigida-like protein 4a, partial [Phtheirospermum japonicum]